MRHPLAHARLRSNPWQPRGPISEFILNRTIARVGFVCDRRIYAGAYNRNAQSIEFFEFTRTMQAYKDIISDGNTLVLSTDSDLFKFLKGIDPELVNGKIDNRLIGEHP